jgi:hypothetical protein
LTEAHSVVCSFCQSLERQQTISVILSPKGMYRRVTLEDCALTVAASAERASIRRQTIVMLLGLEVAASAWCWLGVPGGHPGRGHKLIH